MTEDEATSKRCCGPEGCGTFGNPKENGTCDRYCIGSACMAWRWFRSPDDAASETEFQKSCSGPDQDKIVEPDGFCGLAGKP